MNNDCEGASERRQKVGLPLATDGRIAGEKGEAEKIIVIIVFVALFSEKLNFTSRGKIPLNRRHEALSRGFILRNPKLFNELSLSS